MTAEDVVALHRGLGARGLDWCVAGGWGVDALLGYQTRPHKDLDVLLPASDLAGILDLLEVEGFRLSGVWDDQSLPLPGTLPLLGVSAPSAFVLADDRGREVDIHVMAKGRGVWEPLWMTDDMLREDDLAGTGRVLDMNLWCMTAAKQLEVHTGYEMPAVVAESVQRLRELVDSRVR